MYIRYLYSLLLFCSPVLLFAQQAEEEKKHIGRAKAGMSEKELLKVAGEPERKERFKTIQTGLSDTTCYWLYQNEITVILRNHNIEKIERDRNGLLLKIQEWADPKNKDGIKLIYGK